YVCATHKNEKTCYTHSLRDTALYEIVLNLLKKHIQDVIDLSDLLRLTDTAQLQQANIQKLQGRLGKKQEEIDRCQALLRSLYESLNDGVIDQDEYQELKKTYTRRRTEAEEQAEAIQQEMGRELNTQDCGWMEQFRKHQNIETLDRNIVVSLIERIVIYREHRVEVVFHWHNEFRWQMDLLLRAQASLSEGESV
ncbi:MAG: recombinase, partial [Oscillospiraceae bacterium]|nr:recombinase [Oscillospiraceae bacterium]